MSIDEGGYMRTITLLALVLFLIGCESEFDKCMKTELPRAETLIGIESEREVGRQLVSMKEYTQAEAAIQPGLDAWIEENPYPSGGPEYPSYPNYECRLDEQKSLDERFAEFSECTSAHDKKQEEYEKLVEEYEAADAIFEATPAVVTWRNLQPKEYERLLRAYGYPFDSLEELELEPWWTDDFYETVLKPRSEIYQCLNDTSCDEYNYGDDDYYLEILNDSLSEAIVNNAIAITELLESSKQLATVTCNNNGLYE